MIELEIILDRDNWPSSWLLNPVEITAASGQSLFSGIITAENYELINASSLKAVFIIQPLLPLPSPEKPSVITRPIHQYPDIPHLSPSEGTLWPIPENSEVLISTINHNPDNPIALASLYNHINFNPVTQQNFSEHILKTSHQNQFLISDNKNNLSFIYQTNKINLNNNLSLINQLGNTVLNSQKNIQYTIQKNLIETSENNYIKILHKNFSIATEAGNISYKSTKSIYTETNHSINFTATQTIEINTAHLENLSEKNLAIMAQHAITLESLGEILFQAGEEITIASEETLKLMMGNSYIEILKSGIINFNAPQITVSGQPILSVVPIGPA